MRRAAGALAALAVAGAVAAAVPAALPGGGRADAACALFVAHHGAPFLGTAGSVQAPALAGSAGTGIVPGCDDVVGPGAPPPVPDATVPLRRVAGVAPRFGVAMRLGGGPYALMIREGHRCAAAPALRCLRAATTRFLRGPSLIAPLSAPAGGTIRVAVRLPRRPPAAPSGPVVLRAARPGPGAVAGPLVRSRGAVVLPDVPPGEYRLVALVGRQGDARGIAARITVR